MSIPPTNNTSSTIFGAIYKKVNPVISPSLANLSKKIGAVAQVAMSWVGKCWACLQSPLAPLLARIARGPLSEVEKEVRAPLLANMENSSSLDLSESPSNELEDASTASEWDGKLVPDARESAAREVFMQSFPLERQTFEKFGALDNAFAQLKLDIDRADLRICGNRITSLEDFARALEATPFAECKSQVAELLSQAGTAKTAEITLLHANDRLNLNLSKDEIPIAVALQHDFGMYQVNFAPMGNGQDNWSIQGSMSFRPVALGDFRSGEIDLAQKLTITYSTIIEQKRSHQPIWDQLSFTHTAKVEELIKSRRLIEMPRPATQIKGERDNWHKLVHGLPDCIVNFAKSNLSSTIR